MKYKQKYLDNLYKDPTTNFKEIVDICIYFEDKAKLDWSSEAVSAIQQLDRMTLVQLLFIDHVKRSHSHIVNYGYQRIWWSLINNKDHQIEGFIRINMNDSIRSMFLYWLNSELDSDVDTYHNINRLL